MGHLWFVVHVPGSSKDEDTHFSLVHVTLKGTLDQSSQEEISQVNTKLEAKLCKFLCELGEKVERRDFRVWQRIEYEKQVQFVLSLPHTASLKLLQSWKRKKDLLSYLCRKALGSNAPAEEQVVRLVTGCLGDRNWMIELERLSNRECNVYQVDSIPLQSL